MSETGVTDDLIFERIVNSPYDAEFCWNGVLILEKGSERVSGPGFVRAGYTGAHGEIHYQDRTLAEKLEKGELVTQDDILPAFPGMIARASLFGEVRPAEGDAFVGHRARIVRRRGDLLEADANFTIFGDFIIMGSGNATDVTFIRHTFIDGDLPRQRIDGRFQDCLFSLSTYHDGVRRHIFAVLKNPGLSAVRGEALWLVVNFLSGKRVTPVSVESFDSKGELVFRTQRVGAPSTSATEPPFDKNLSPNALELFSDCFVRMLEGQYPINNILHHVHDSDGTSIDTDLQHLILAIHASFEAWNRVRGQTQWLLPDEWEHTKKIILDALKPALVEPVPEGLRNSIIGNVRRLNETSTNFRQREFFESLDIKPNPEEKAALDDRDELLHNGYFLKRFAQLAAIEQQERFDKLGHLRNLAYLTIMRIAGYSGLATEFTRLGTRTIASPRGPIPFTRA